MDKNKDVCSLFLESVTEAPEAKEHTFSLSYRLKRKTIIKNAERKSSAYRAPRKHGLGYLPAAAAVLLLSSLIVISSIAARERSERHDYCAAELLSLKAGDVILTETLDGMAFFSEDMSGYEREVYMDTDSKLYCEYKNGSKWIELRQFCSSIGSPYLFGENMLNSPTAVTIAGFPAVYYENLHGTRGYIIFTGDMWTVAEGNVDKTELDRTVGSLEYRKGEDQND